MNKLNTLDKRKSLTLYFPRAMLLQSERNFKLRNRAQTLHCAT